MSKLFKAVIISIFAFLFISPLINSSQGDTIQKYEDLFQNKKYDLLIQNLAPVVMAYESGKESFLNDLNIVHARNLIADSYRNIEKYEQAAEWYGGTIDGYMDSYAKYNLQLIKRISIITGRSFKPDVTGYYGAVLYNLLDETKSVKQKQQYFTNLAMKGKKDNWVTKLYSFCAGDLSLDKFLSSVPKEFTNIANTYAGLSLEVYGDKTKARELYKKVLAQQSSEIESLLAANRLGVFVLKITYTTDLNDVNTISNVYSSKVSSAKLEDNRLYSVQNSIDGDPKTTWVPDSKKSGIGEWIEISFDDPIPVNSLTITNGYARSDTAFKNNNRLKTATLEFSDGSQQKITLEDTMEPQTIEIGKETQKIKLTIDEVYKGAKYDDTCLSEVDVKFKNSTPTSSE